MMNFNGIDSSITGIPQDYLDDSQGNNVICITLFSLSCNRCFSKKLKCDRRHPSCGRCESSKVECMYNSKKIPACLNCAKVRMKCSKDLFSACVRCQTKGLQCEYPDPGSYRKKRKMGPSKNQLANLAPRSWSEVIAQGEDLLSPDGSLCGLGPMSEQAVADCFSDSQWLEAALMDPTEVHEQADARILSEQSKYGVLPLVNDYQMPNFQHSMIDYCDQKLSDDMLSTRCRYCGQLFCQAGCCSRSPMIGTIVAAEDFLATIQELSGSPGSSQFAELPPHILITTIPRSWCTGRIVRYVILKRWFFQLEDVKDGIPESFCTKIIFVEIDLLANNYECLENGEGRVVQAQELYDKWVCFKSKRDCVSKLLAAFGLYICSSSKLEIEPSLLFDDGMVNI